MSIHFWSGAPSIAEVTFYNDDLINLKRAYKLANKHEPRYEGETFYPEFFREMIGNILEQK